ncbi:MAG: leucyl aminopeptidase, partial [Proteobacteria bacterium]|nr:leucyl aminopeptidase [Pseudomonadota bacterium]
TTEHVKQATHSFSQLGCVTEGVFKTREVVTEPANVLYPESFAKSVQQLQEIGVKVEIFGEKEMKKLGMNALLGVGQGSVKESQLVIMQWQGLKKDTAPLAFVGKGVTFDSGGLSLKPRTGMAEMKSDMAGAGTVLGLIQALALRKAKVNVVGIIGLAENMPSGTAQRPGDIVTSLSGQTIEILDTDAEGRLVLADALWYAQDRFKPKVMIDLATLTGAIVIALGHEYAGFFSDNEELALQILESSKATGEKLWRLPLHESYDKTLDSDIADVKNLGSDGAGSITAAHFLKRFTNKVPWIHIDIAGTAWSKKDQPLWAKGATAFGVRLLNHFVTQYYEQ